jgi:hypothetical protein
MKTRRHGDKGTNRDICVFPFASALIRLNLLQPLAEKGDKNKKRKKKQNSSSLSANGGNRD